MATKKQLTMIKKIFILLVTVGMLSVSCKKEETGDNPIEDDLQYSLKITNPIENYSIANGSKVSLSVQPDSQMSVGSYDFHFYIDNQEVNLTPISEFDIDLFTGNYAYQWQVTGLSLGDHQIKAEYHEGNTVVARDEITVKIVAPKWEEVNLISVIASSTYVINDIFLLNDQVGWLSGYSGNGRFLLKTTDKGASWQPVNYNLDIEKITFYNETIGVAIAGVGKVYKTFDGGASFSLVTDPVTGASLFNSAMDVSFSQTAGEYQVTAKDINNLKKVFRVRLNDDTILQYTDVVPDSSMLLYEMKFDGANGLIYGMEEPATDLQYIQLSTDNGQSWQGVSIPAPSDWLGGNNSFQIEGGDISGNKIWLTGGDNTDYLSAFSAVSSDGGQSWQIKRVTDKLSFYTQSFLDVAMTSDKNAYAVNYDNTYFPAMYYSDDDGENWMPLYEVSPSAHYHIDKIAFKSNDFGIAAGENIIYRFKNN